MEKHTIFRFSKQGFLAFEQNKHKEDVENTLEFESQHGLNAYPKHLRHFIQLHTHILINNWQNYTKGIFVFLSYPSIEDSKFLLNHLKGKDISDYHWWQADIDISEMAFDPCNGNLWKKEGYLSVKEMIEKRKLEMFLPVSSMNSIQNIKKISYNKNNYQLK